MRLRFCLLFFISHTIISQPVVDKSFSDIHTLIGKARAHSSDSAQALSYLRQALHFADSLSATKDQCRVLNELGNLLYDYGQFSSAYKYYTRSQQIAAANMFIRQEAESLKGLAHIEWRTGDNIKSVNNILQSIKKFKTLHDTSGIIDASDILAGIYVSMGKLDDASSIYSDMLQLSKAVPDSVKQAQAYEHLGVVAFFRGDYQKAIEAYQKSLTINQLLAREVEVGINNANIGEALDYQGKHQSALQYFQKAQEALEKHHFNSGLVFVHYATGRAYTHLGKLQEGISHYKKSLKYISTTGEIREMPQVYELMAENYVKQRQYKSAYELYKKRTHIKDSIDNVDKSKQIETIRTRYEVKEMEEENERLALANQRKAEDIKVQQQTIFLQSVSLILLLLLIAVFAFLYSKIRVQKRQLDIANSTKDQLLSIIGHDLRGPIGNLQSITSLIVDKKAWGENEELRKIVIMVKKDINKAYFLINDLLDWARSQKEGIRLEKAKLDLKDEVDNTIALLKINASQKDINSK